MKLDNVRAYLETFAMSARGVILENGSDVELARKTLDIIDGHHPYGRCVSCAGKIYHYEPKKALVLPDGVWRVLPDDVVAAMVGCFDGVPISGRKRLQLSAARVDGAIKCIKRDPEILVADDFFQRAPLGVAVENAFITVSSEGFEVNDFEAHHRIRSKCGFAYFDEKDHPAWTRLILNLFDCDDNAAQKHDVLQEFIGAAMTGIATNYDKALILDGGGNNGKSTLIDAIKLLFPKDATKAIPMRMWGKEYYAAMMDGLVLNCVGEVPNQRILDSDVVKSVIAGDEIIGRHSYGRPFRIFPRAAHIMACNELPESADSSSGFWRRFIVLRFNRNMGDLPRASQRTRREILEEIEDELPAIANWALTGAVRLLRNGKYTDTGDAALDEWRAESGSVPHFVNDAIEITRGDEWMRLADILARFNRWAEFAGSEKMGNRKLGRRLTSLGVPKRRISGGMEYRCRVKEEKEWSVKPQLQAKLDDTSNFFN